MNELKIPICPFYLSGVLNRLSWPLGHPSNKIRTGFIFIKSFSKVKQPTSMIYVRRTWSSMEMYFIFITSSVCINIPIRKDEKIILVALLLTTGLRIPHPLSWFLCMTRLLINKLDGSRSQHSIYSLKDHLCRKRHLSTSFRLCDQRW